MVDSVDLLLVYPNNRARAYGSAAESVAAVTPPVGLALVAGFIRRQGFRVQILDAEAENLTTEQTADFIVRRAPLLMLMASDQLNSGDVTKMIAAGETLTALKKRASSVRTILEGAAPSAFPEKMLREEHVDFVCQGEAYLPVSELLRELKAGKKYPDEPIEGLWYLKSERLISSKRPPLWREPDELPQVPWDLLPLEKYRAHHWHCFDRLDARRPYAAIYTNLGCPYDCSFCSVNIVFGEPNYRARSAESVVAEIDLLVKKYKVRNIRIVDNVFTIQPAFVERLCDLIIRGGYDLNLWAYARVETVKDAALLKKMKKAGVNWLAYGIEAGDPEIRKKVSKGSSDDVIDKAVELTKAAGIHIVGNFIFGLPEESLKTMQATLDMAKEYNFEWANFYCAMAYPGTALHEYARESGIRLPKDWQSYGQYSSDSLPMSTRHLSAADVLRFRDQAFIDYYSSPRYMRMLERTFGSPALEFIRQILAHKLPRKLLAGPA